ncbi:hypothetical protein ACFL0Y_00010 [Patescibacteria group bacterium]
MFQENDKRYQHFKGAVGKHRGEVGLARDCGTTAGSVIREIRADGKEVGPFRRVDNTFVGGLASDPDSVKHLNVRQIVDSGEQLQLSDFSEKLEPKTPVRIIGFWWED